MLLEVLQECTLFVGELLGNDQWETPSQDLVGGGHRYLFPAGSGTFHNSSRPLHPTGGYHRRRKVFSDMRARQANSLLVVA